MNTFRGWSLPSSFGVFFLFALMAFAGLAEAQQRYPIESKSEWQAEGKYTKQHIIDAGDIPGHQIRILELHRTYNEKSRFAVSGVKVKESWYWGYSDYIKGVGTAWGYSVWTLEDGGKVFVESSGNSNTQPTGSGAVEGTYHGTARLTGGTGKYRGIRGTMTDAVEFNTDPTSGYNRGNSKGEYWFVE
jgi:hypothetical protein